MKKVLILAILLALTGCDKTQQEPAAQGEQQALAEEAPLVLGTLTYENMQQVSQRVDPFQPWEPAWRQVLETVGNPTTVEENHHYWYLMHDNDCVELVVENRDGQVGIVGVTEYSDLMRERFARCQGQTPSGGEAEEAAAQAEPEAAGMAEEAAEAVEGAAAEGQQEAAGMVEGAAEAVEGTAEAVEEGTTEAAEDTVEAVEGAVEGAPDAVRGLTAP